MMAVEVGDPARPSELRAWADADEEPEVAGRLLE
jgi:hypothetical protein